MKRIKKNRLCYLATEKQSHLTHIFDFTEWGPCDIRRCDYFDYLTQFLLGKLLSSLNSRAQNKLPKKQFGYSQQNWYERSAVRLLKRHWDVRIH
jgi:hypothetical protein